MAQSAASAPALSHGVAASRPAAASPPEGRPSQRHTYAALDLGTNNCRLLIARPADSGFAVIDAFSRVVRLGEGLATSGRISDAAIERALAALSICGDKLRRRNVSLARSGSTELVLIDTDGITPRIKCWWSAPWGVVSLTESEGRDFPDAAARVAAYGRMRERVKNAFKRFAELLPTEKENVRLLGTSGTVTTLASVHLALPSYDRKAIDGLMVPADSMRAISEMMSRMSLEERAQLPCIGLERADLVVAGCAILEAIMDIWPAKTLGVADRGIREGILRSLMARDGHKI